MKKIKDILIPILQIIISFSLVPLFKVKFFKKIIVTPIVDDLGNTTFIQTIKTFSIIDKFKYDPLLLIPIAYSLITFTIIISFLSIFIKHKNLKIASLIFTICSVFYFLFLLWVTYLLRKTN